MLLWEKILFLLLTVICLATYSITVGSELRRLWRNRSHNLRQ
jgi:hypothetical protein